MSSSGSSFRKRVGTRVPFILGTKPSIQNAQLLTSTGVPSLDTFIGGGIPIGTLFLIEEDVYGNFAKLLFKYYLAEGVISQHDLHVVSQDVDPVQMIEDLPKPIEKANLKEGSHFGPKDQMNIAWRYQNLPSVQTEPDTDFGHHYDITQKMDPAQMQKVNITYWNADEIDGTHLNGNNAYYEELLESIQQRIKNGQFYSEDSPKKRNVLRIGVQSLGSLLWGRDSTNLILFLYKLRSLLQSSYCVCLLTIPTHLIKKISDVHRCQHLCDTAVKLESFAGSDRETNPIFKDYHGLFYINKLPAINSLCSHVPGSFDLAFKLRRKRFSIEMLHLPPELQETTQREQDDFGSVMLGCSNPRSKTLDF
ncbi:Putative elongator complex protein 4 [Gryllus bimaculatus]|nr:Putative elongator complex protein 4 [Gryllus bimaculatus]